MDTPVTPLMNGHLAVYEALRDLVQEKEQLANQVREKETVISALEDKYTQLQTRFRVTWQNQVKVLKLFGGHSPCRKCNGEEVPFHWEKCPFAKG